MCGIIGIIGENSVSDDLIKSLERLEYRGYDSAGIATVYNGRMDRRRANGKLKNLISLIHNSPLKGSTGIGHTRWATHGRPTERNAHPHMNEDVSVVHNGIIENFRELRSELEKAGCIFYTETDTETIAHMISYYIRHGAGIVDAVGRALKRLKGTFALGIIFSTDEDIMIAARRGSPLAIGHGNTAMYIGSDAIALAPFTSAVTYLEEGDWAVISSKNAIIRDSNDEVVQRSVTALEVCNFQMGKGNHRHYMHKEIHEQPEVISRTLSNYIDKAELKLHPFDIGVDLSTIDRIIISGCGTSFYSSLVGRYWIERYACIPVEVDFSSELRYREPPLSPNSLALFISQSGETADTLAALRYFKAKHQTVASVVNVHTSTIARESNVVIPTLAGSEVGVASTKAFTCQLSAIACFCLMLAKSQKNVTKFNEREIISGLVDAPNLIAAMLSDERPFNNLAYELAKASNVLYLGRGINCPVALEGALKLKEVSYIHAEGYPAGELKHGPIALVDEKIPVIVLAPKDKLFNKTVSNMQEIASRGGRIVFVSDANSDEAGCELLAHLPIPKAHPCVMPLLCAVSVQLIAYHTAVIMGTDIDQPRNLAKSVTVE
ncbi:MAG: glutamine--fructose-6-phosphate transaminase (isomerizing) [Hyphomicrobiaceae bacterium]|nr:glutamine--fructose-6-phosphate transaminase (isomerizing) [Hyphomicrobiaceae bacterium]